MKFPFSRFIVAEESMLPAYKPGAHVLTFNWSSIKSGDVIVFKTEGRYYVKRVTKIAEGKVEVTGDNKARSKRVEPVSAKFIIGKVIWRYS